jgi:hypothetical protein
MKRIFALVLVVAIGVTFSGQSASAQDLSRYRTYALETSFDMVLAASGARVSDAKILHERPAKIQQLEWRAPYVRPGNELADPVRGITFTFCDDALYQIVVDYDRDRTEGLTNADVVASLSTAYGTPIRFAAPAMASLAETLGDAIVVAHWDSAPASVTLVRGAFSPELRLILVAKPLHARARAAIKAAARLDILDAPRRELEQQKKDVEDAAAASAKARTINKPAFRP